MSEAMTRPTAHAAICPRFVVPDESDIDCTCGLEFRKRIFDLERRIAGMPEVGEPERGASHVTWRDNAESGVSVWRGSILLTYPASGPSPAEARWLAAALLAAANEAEG